MIIFKEVSYRNFLSTGNTPNTILLNRVPSAIVTGQNGAGKSTMLDALCFGLYGKPYRNIAKNQLINTVNEKNCVVEIVFEANGVEYKVVRGLKPNVFEIWRGDNLMNHDAAIRDYQKKLEDIVGLNMRAFTQIVILGSARYQSFMDLNSTDRRVIIEEILDITVFSKMNSVLKTKTTNIDLDIKENDYQKEIIRTKISAQKGLIENLMNRTKESEEKVQQERTKVEAQIALIDIEVSRIDSEISKLPAFDLADLNAKKTAAQLKYKEVEGKLNSIQDKINFFEKSDECHHCGQSITEETKEKQVTTLNEDEQKLSKAVPVFEEVFKKLLEKIDQGNEVVDKQRALQMKRNSLVAERKTLATMLSSLKVSTKESDDTSIAKAKDELIEFDQTLLQTEKHHHQLLQTRHYYEICKILLKDDGIKSKIIKQYLPVMNKLINQFLDRMGANYSFNLDENFNEIIKSRYRDTFSYASFSEGEKSRVDLALVMTWREIAKLKNSAATNLLIFDEVGDSSLDGEGSDVLWDIIGDLKDSNVFVISHRTANVERFTSHIEFIKSGNFSHIKDSKTKQSIDLAE